MLASAIMKWQHLVSLLILSAFSPLWAGDMDLSKQTQPAALETPFSWEGFYVGAHAGGNWGTAHSQDLNFFRATFPDAPSFDYDTSGFVGGLQAGYNWQRGHLVLGIESDFGYMNIDGSGTHPFDRGTSTSWESDFYSTLRARAGFASNRWLFYITGGGILARSDLGISSDVTGGGFPDRSDLGISSDVTGTSHRAFVPGITGGAGIEYAFNNRWSVKLEYLYYELEDDPVAINNGQGQSEEGFDVAFFSMQNSGHIARLGVNYHFGSEAAVESFPVYSGKDGKTMLQPTAPMETYNWTGPYAGLHFGYGAGGIAWLDEPRDDTDNMQHQWQNGIFGGVTAGLNYQLHCFVVGLEGKFSGSAIDASYSKDPNDEPNTFATDIDWRGSIAMRAGLAPSAFMNGRLLFYGTFGLSLAHQNYYWDHLDTFGGGQHDIYDSSERRYGPLLGAGVEWAFAQHWTMRVEYDFAEYDKKIIHGPRFDFPVTETEAYLTKLRTHSVEVGVSYKF